MRENPGKIYDANVCVVGGAGFLGSHLVNHLIEERLCNVTVVDNLTVGRREFIHPAARFEHHDITGSETHLAKFFNEHQTQFVFNYAAHPYIPVSYDRPLHVFETNATGAMKVINGAQEAHCEAILQVSSAEIYGSAKLGVLNESYPVEPHSTYGVAKAAVDQYCQTSWKERNTRVISMRQFNCVGPRETHPYVIPEIISQIHVGKREGMYYRVDLGNNTHRDFLAAGDAVRMATELLEHGEFGQVYNMGSESAVQIYDLACMIGRLMGRDCVVRKDETRVRPWEIWYLMSDNTKLYDTIAYRPQMGLEDSLELTIEDFHRNGDKWVWQ